MAQFHDECLLLDQARPTPEQQGTQPAAFKLRKLDKHKATHAQSEESNHARHLPWYYEFVVWSLLLFHDDQGLERWEKFGNGGAEVKNQNALDGRMHRRLKSCQTQRGISGDQQVKVKEGQASVNPIKLVASIIW